MSNLRNERTCRKRDICKKCELLSFSWMTLINRTTIKVSGKLRFIDFLQYRYSPLLFTRPIVNHRNPNLGRWRYLARFSLSLGRNNRLVYLRPSSQRSALALSFAQSSDKSIVLRKIRRQVNWTAMIVYKQREHRVSDARIFKNRGWNIQVGVDSSIRR